MAAIATKKRLYTKALDSLTSSSQISLAPSDTAPKRSANAIEAFDEARERARKRLRNSTSTSSLPPIVVPSPSSKINPTLKDPPNYAPWSHEAFLARLKTFSSVSLWHPKPESISEVQWAKRGWSCVDVNTVRCKGGCERRAVVSLALPVKKVDVDPEPGDDGNDGDSEEDEAFEHALAERYQDVIINGHSDSCLWRKGGCKDDIYHLQVVRPAVWQPALRKRFESIREMQSAIENIVVVPVDKSRTAAMSAETLLHDLTPTVLGEDVSDSMSQDYSKALEIALHGWRGSKESGSELLHCDACFQRIGLWMYQPGYRPRRPTEDDDGDVDTSSATLDLVHLHREHCPWRNPASQHASGSLNGLNACEILQRVVSTFARDHRRRSGEQQAVLPDEANDPADETDGPVYSKEEIARQDKERESRLQKLKGLFNIRRRSTKSLPKAPVV